MYLPDVPNIYIGGEAVERVYLGEEIVWPADYSGEYTTLEILSAGTLHFQSQGCYDGQVSSMVVLDYSINGDPWTHVTWSTDINVQAGDKVRLKALYGDRVHSLSPGDYAPSLSGSTAVFNVYGNSLSLLYGDSFTAYTQSTAYYAFSFLFLSTNIVSAKLWVLPQQQTYYAKWFNQTFTEAPLLKEGPVFRCASAADSAFDWCFLNCTSLERIVIPYLEQIPQHGFNAWVANVPATGTFVKKSGASWRWQDQDLVWHNYGQNGIPLQWDITEA